VKSTDEEILHGVKGAELQKKEMIGAEGKKKRKE